MKKKRLRLKLKFVIMFFVIFLITFIISLANIIKWSIDSSKTNKEIEKIQQIVKINSVTSNENVEIINENPQIEKSNPYWDYIKMNLIDVDFNKLRETNDEIKGWIQVNGTNINYPFVQANDNDYYLNHSLDKKSNGAGWVFLDYRNALTNNQNTIIYAHGRTNKTMFGSLKDTLKENWLNNPNNHVIKLSTEKENSLWQVFSVYKIPTTSDYLKINFNENEFEKFSEMLINRSIYNFNTSLDNNDKILTLSTCYNNDEKIVLHAKLIKKQCKE